MNFPLFMARRISTNGNRSFSRLIVRVAVAGIVLGLSIMILSLAVLRGFKEEIIAKQRGFTGDVTIFKFDFNESYDNTPFVLNDSAKRVLEQTDGLARVSGIATKPGIIHVNNEVEGVVLKGINKDYDQSFIRSILFEGSTINFSDNENAREQVIISKVTASRLNLEVGDSFIMYFVQEPLRKRRLNVVGVYNLGVEDVDETYVIGHLDLIQRLNDWEAYEVGAYEITLDSFENIASKTYEISQKLPLDLRVMSVEDQYSQVFKWLDLLDVNTEVIFILMLIVAIINMISALLIMILERTPMIGTLKALGLSNRGVRKIFLYRASYLIAIGLVLGNLIGLGICFFQESTHFLKLDEASYYISYVPILLKYTDVLYLNLGVMGICITALLIPSGLVSRISPVKAILFK